MRLPSIVDVPMLVPPHKGPESSLHIGFSALWRIWDAQVGIQRVPVPLLLLHYTVTEHRGPLNTSSTPWQEPGTSVPVRLPPQKGLECSSGSRQQALGIAVRVPVRLPSTETSRKFSSRKQAAHRRHRRRPNARPSTERSRKFFSNNTVARCPRAGTPK